VASKYDNLDAYTELEQRFAADLEAALAPRGCEVRHHGAANKGRHAPGGVPDIEVRDPGNKRLVLVEITRRKSSAADGEFLAITDHLARAIASGGFRDYCLLYVSPATSPRMSTNIRDLWNATREREGLPGRIFFLDFEGAEMMLEKLSSSDPALYPASRLGDLFDRWADAVDDARARQIVQATIFPEDHALALDLANEAKEIDAERERQLKRQLLKIEDKLRDYGITGNDANATLVYLSFMRLYEERRQRETGEANRFTVTGFTKWRDAAPAAITRQYVGRVVEALLHEIAEDPQLEEAGLLRNDQQVKDRLHQRLTDDLVEELILPVLDQYDFHAGRVDVLGAVFETLARRSEKDTRIGQFFTPQQVVDFCADLVRLRPHDIVLDPAVGTARFLIAAMMRMLDDADLSGYDRRKVEDGIRAQQLLGADIDGWVATIAKMNMFIHGDGKSNIEAVNGLILGDSPVFSAYKSGVEAAIDVVLTNPPLGETRYTVAADDWLARHDSGKDSAMRVSFYERLGVVPLRIVEEREVEVLQRKLDEWTDKVSALEEEPSTRNRDSRLRRARRARDDRALRLAELRQRLVTGEVTREPSGEAMKGGALFLGAIARYLKRDRDPSALLEWQGGHAAVIVDEAILNTPEYAPVRAFIRDNFYIKAVISLSRDAFRYLAHTDAKTSILYVLRKPLIEVSQVEPIFFGHADRVGYSARGDWIGDDLPQILLHYRMFQDAVARSYVGAYFDREACNVAVSALPGFANAFFAEFDAGKAGSRLDFFGARYKEREKELRSIHGQLISLADILEVRRVEHPEPSRSGEYEFAGVNRVEGTVQSKGVQEVDYPASDLWMVRTGDVVVSGIDLVHGAIGVARDDVDGLVMSKEMFAFRTRPDVKVLPEYVQLLLRTKVAQELLMGLVTGTSNRTRLESAEQLLNLPIPPLPSLDYQEEHALAVQGAHQLRREATRRLASAHTAIATVWRQAERVELPDPRVLPVVEAEVLG
jgi:N-6 DNA Methylase